MKILLSIWLICSSCLFVASQNLVPNPSFEEFTECPDSALELDVEGAYPWTSFRGTPDFFHPCDITGMMSSPNSISYGYGVPFHGVGKAGFIAAGWFMNREVLAVPLQSALTVGTSYFISLQFLRTFGGGAHFNCDCAVNNIGLKFTTQTYTPSLSGQIPIDNQAHLKFEQVLADSTNWTELSGWFTADSAYTHLAIGVFFDNDHIAIENYNGYQLGYNTYYFVDAVCISDNPLDCDELRLHTAEAVKPDNNIEIFPNPAIEHLHIRSNNKIQSVAVMDITGRLTMTIPISGHRYQLDTQGLTNGIYILRVKFENGNLQNHTFIKE